MSFRLKSLLILTFVISCLFAGYAFKFRPKRLKCGMEQAAVLAALEQSQAYDVVAEKGGGKYQIVLPTKDKRLALEQEREAAIALTNENLNKFWFVPNYGIVEFHFDDGRLKKMIQWVGSEDRLLPKVLLQTK